jgi:hypothetical protein
MSLLHLSVAPSEFRDDMARFARLARRAELAMIACGECEDRRLHHKLRALDARVAQIERHIHARPVTGFGDLVALALIAKFEARHTRGGDLHGLSEDADRDEQSTAHLIQAVLALGSAQQQQSCERQRGARPTWRQGSFLTNRSRRERARSLAHQGPLKSDQGVGVRSKPLS